MAKMRKVTTVRGVGQFVGANHVEVQETASAHGQEKAAPLVAGSPFDGTDWSALFCAQHAASERLWTGATGRPVASVAACPLVQAGALRGHIEPKGPAVAA